MSSIAIVGAGFSGAVIARELAENGCQVQVFDGRSHVAGNCHTERDTDTGVLVHKYGPHIFHTSNQRVWDYVNRFVKFEPYSHKVKAIAKGRVYTLPINLHTINQFFQRTFSPDEARAFIESLSSTSTAPPVTLEDQALHYLGRDLYKTFIKCYTEKQWGRPAASLPASILSRLPVRFIYNDNYFSDQFQGIPVEGYTELIGRILDHPDIDLILQTSFNRRDKKQFDHVFHSGSIDSWFGWVEGPLEYRTLDFEEIRVQGDSQGCAVLNYVDADVPWTRITEHKYFAPWEEHHKSVCYREYSRECQAGDIPYYPVNLVESNSTLRQYIAMSEQEHGVSFVGRLGTYRYLNMDIAIKEALDASRLFLHCIRNQTPVPAFFAPPL